MGLYIGGIKMPKEGNWITLRIFPDGECSLYSWCGTDFDFMGHLTAVPVSPHGRLIDADEMIKTAKQQVGHRIGEETYTMVEHFARHAPTIIPASEEEA